MPKQRSVLPCIPPKYPSNFLFCVPNRKNRVEGKRIEKSWICQKFIRCAVVFLIQSWTPDDLKDHQMTPNGKPTPKLKIPCANNTCGFGPHHWHRKKPTERYSQSAFLFNFSLVHQERRELKCCKTQRQSRLL